MSGGVEGGGFGGEEAGGGGVVCVGVEVVARSVERSSVVAVRVRRVGDEFTGGVVAMVGFEGG